MGTGLVVGITTVPLQLIRAAEAYDDAAVRLHRVRVQLPHYQKQVELAEQVHWDSMASESFHSVLQLLKVPGMLMSLELPVLADAASAIAADLRHYAQLAQKLMSLMGSAGPQFPLMGAAWEIATDRFDMVWQEATSALDGDAAQFVEFIDRHGGIPHIIEQGVRQALLPW